MIIAHTSLFPVMNKLEAFICRFLFSYWDFYKDSALLVKKKRRFRGLTLSYFAYSLIFLMINSITFQNINEIRHSVSNIVRGEGIPNVLWFLGLFIGMNTA